MVNRGNKSVNKTPKKKAKNSTVANDCQKGLIVRSKTTDSLLLSPTNMQTVRKYAPSTSAGSPSHSSDAQSDSATILAYLKKIDESNEALARRVQDLQTDSPQPLPSNANRYICHNSHKHGCFILSVTVASMLK